MSKFLIKLALLLLIVALPLVASAQKNTFVSLSPAITEIMYSLGAQNSLIGVSTRCSYPIEAKRKPIIGDSYFLNKEKIIKLHPNYIFSVEATQGTLNEFENTNIKPLYFKMNSINDIYTNIRRVAQLTNKETQGNILIKNIQNKISNTRASKPKRILYLIQTNPMITVGNKSFITDIIKKSGNYSISQDIKGYYPTISTEFVMKSKPDVVLISFSSDKALMKRIFPKSKIVILTNEYIDIINRPSPRVYKSVEFFSKL